MKIFSGSSNLPLAQKICSNLKLPIGCVFLKNFPSGERYCQFQENIRGGDVFLIQSTSKPVNDYLMELLIMVDAARRASAGRITAVLPYFGYARQDRKDLSRVPISGKLVMDILGCAGVNRILTMDLHSPQTVGFTNLPVDQLGFRPALIESIKNLGIDCVVSPDIGAVKRADEYASSLKMDLAIVSKKRIGDTEVKIKNFIGDVKGKKVIIIDDLVESAGTFIESAIICKNEGATEIYCAVSHGCFTEIGYERLFDAFKQKIINKLFVSNSISFSEMFEDIREYVEIVDISPWFSQAIYNIYNNESVSKLF